MSLVQSALDFGEQASRYWGFGSRATPTVSTGQTLLAANTILMTPHFVDEGVVGVSV